MSLFSADEELGKRDDDYKYSKKAPPAASWQHRRSPMRRNVKKLMLGLGLLVLAYVFIKNIPTDVKHSNLRPNYQHISKAGVTNGKTTQNQVLGAPGAPKARTASSASAYDDEDEYYDGPIKFYQLATSLHAASSATKGGSSVNTNVMFAAANLKSAATLLPLACEMAIWKRNHVHFALLGRDDISMELLKAVNSVDKGCDITFHGQLPFLDLHSEADIESRRSCRSR